MAGIEVQEDTLVIDTDTAFVAVDGEIRFVNFDVASGSVTGTVVSAHNISGSIRRLQTIHN
ncbi:MAG: hypothetical protein J6S14_03085 [Clostridia bacterium]|nr:hypothetical protein [Clostridia bacterium]